MDDGTQFPQEFAAGDASEEAMSPQELRQKNADGIAATIAGNKKLLAEKVGAGVTLDVILREMTFAGKQCLFFYLNGFVKDEAMAEVMKRLSLLRPEEGSPDTLQRFVAYCIPHVQVETTDNLSDAVLKVLAGGSALFVEGETTAIIIDTRQFPVRSIQEPDLEKVVRGSRDGFTETMMTNISLMRRRIRDERLKLEGIKIGKRTKTDVCVAYIGDIADISLVKAVKEKLRKVNVDGIPLADKQLEEAIVGKRWNPFPIVRYSERPDVVANHLLEGHVVLFVDTSPSVMILPTTYFHLVQHAEEYRQAPFIGTYLRWVRFLGIASSVLLLPLWYLYVNFPEYRLPLLDFLVPGKSAEIPLFAQLLFIEFGVDLMRMAAVHTPTPLATAMGLIAAILVGSIAVESGLFINEVIVYMAVATIGLFATPSYELAMANRIVRIELLVAVALFQGSGLIAGTTLALVYLVVQRSFNTPYMWPFIPFNARALLSILLRRPFLSENIRPSITKTVDNTRQAK